MKRNPDRQCVSCREMRPKSELIRIVKIDSDVFPDPDGKSNGRGAYVCKSRECIKSMTSRHSLDRAFKIHVSDDVYDRIIKEYLSE